MAFLCPQRLIIAVAQRGHIDRPDRPEEPDCVKQVLGAGGADHLNTMLLRRWTSSAGEVEQRGFKRPIAPQMHGTIDQAGEEDMLGRHISVPLEV